MKDRRSKKMILLTASITVLALLIGSVIAYRKYATTWTITQYGSDSINQQMYYTIESSDGKLVIVDGGYATEDGANAVKSVIEQYDNHVDAWIITHAHPDHVGAFNYIMEKK